MYWMKKEAFNRWESTNTVAHTQSNTDTQKLCDGIYMCKEQRKINKLSPLSFEASDATSDHILDESYINVWLLRYYCVFEVEKNV